jgi:hypothetical protein
LRLRAGLVLESHRRQAGQQRPGAQESAGSRPARSIARIEIKNTTIQGRVQTIVRENIVYRDCRHAPGGLRDVNEALTGRAEPAGDGKLPGAQPAR